MKGFAREGVDAPDGGNDRLSVRSDCTDQKPTLHHALLTAALNYDLPQGRAVIPGGRHAACAEADLALYTEGSAARVKVILDLGTRREEARPRIMRPK